MGVINWWQQWRTKRYISNLHERFNRGFLWAIQAYYLEQKCTKEIENIMYVPNEWAHTKDREFERGASHALEIISVSLMKHGEYRGPDPRK